MISFQLGVITDEISPDFEHALDVMGEYGVRQVEIRELWGKNILALDSDELRRAKEAVSRRGMSVCSIASPFYKCSLGIVENKSQESGAVEKKMHGAKETGRDEQLAMLRRACDIAHEFGAGIVRVFAFWRETAMTPAIFEAIRQAFEEPVAIADREGLVLGLENEHACMLGTGEETAPLLRAFDSPYLRAVWDPGNAFQLDERPFPDGYNAVKDQIIHVHVKDARRVIDSEGKVTRPWTAIGAGEIDFRGQFRALADDGYQGVVSLETHYRNTAGDREASSRECLEALRGMLTEL